MRGLNKSIPQANYKSKKKSKNKKIQGNDKSFKNSALVAIMYDRMTPLMEGKKKKKKK